MNNIVAMSKKDRDALLRVVKGRFELLNLELGRRESLVRRQVRDQVVAENSETIAEFRKRLENLTEEMEALLRKGRDLAVEGEASGLVLGNGAGMVATGNVFHGVQVKDLNEQVYERVEEIRTSGSLNGGLRDLELKITEELLTLDLEGDAKTFMKQIPSIDDVLPLPESMKPKALKK